MRLYRHRSWSTTDVWFTDGYGWSLEARLFDDDGSLVAFDDESWDFRTWADAVAALPQYVKSRSAWADSDFAPA